MLLSNYFSFGDVNEHIFRETYCLLKKTTGLIDKGTLLITPGKNTNFKLFWE